jgi:hypothetical protein
MSKVSKKIKFKCDFCKRDFEKFSKLSEHSQTCEIGKRKKIEKTEEGQIAYRLWCLSFKDTKRKNFDYDIFINHRDYNLFARLATFCIKINVIDPENYMSWCIAERIKIKTWVSELTYEKYIKYFLTHEDPVDAVIRSINYIKSQNIPNYFGTVLPGTFLMAIEMGRISPWLYLLYWHANDMLKRMNTEQINRLNYLIDQSVWAMLQRRHKNICPEIKNTLKKETL